MIRIEIIREEKAVKANFMVEGKGEDIVDEVLTFHKNHIDMLKEITDKLTPTTKLMVLMGLLQLHLDVSEGDDEN